MFNQQRNINAQEYREITFAHNMHKIFLIEENWETDLDSTPS